MHSRVFAALVALAPVVTATAGLASAPAHAGDAVFEDIQLELLPVGTLLGDGLTSVDLHVMMLDSDGSPIEGAELKATATSGRLSAPETISPGLVRLQYVPPAVDATRQAELTLKLKTLDKRRVRRDWGLAVEPPVGQKISVAVTPERLVAGPESTATLSVELFDGAPALREGADLLFRASQGTVEDVQELGGGRYTAVYRPAETETPYPGIVTVVDRRDPTRSYGSVVVPVSVPRSVPLKTRPGTQAFVELGGASAGPFEVDKRGRATAEITVPPGTTGLRVRSVSETDETDETLPLELPPAPRVEFMGHYADLPADRRLGIPVRLVVTEPDGTPASAAPIELAVDAGTVSDPVFEGSGVYSAILTPPSADAAVEASLVARLPDEPGATQDLRFLPVRPAGLAVTTTPATLTKEDRTLTVNARITDETGAPLSGRNLGVQPAGARLAGDITEPEPGTYVAILDRTGRGPVELLLTARPDASHNGPRDLVVVPTRSRLTPDGLSSTTLNILAIDEYGYPVADLDLAIQAIQGDGQLPAKASTGPHGIAQVTYTAGRTPGLVNLWIAAGPLGTNVGLLQLPHDAAPDLALPRSGTEAQKSLHAAWAQVVTTHRVENQ